MLSKSPSKIKIGEIVSALEDDINLTKCVKNPKECDRSVDCKTRDIWEKASRALYGKLTQ